MQSLTEHMEPALTGAAMREADRITIDALGIPGFTLMESAGRAAVEEIELQFGSLRQKKVLCLCGKGNNGGDGLVVARKLVSKGASVNVFMMSPRKLLSDDAGLNFDILTGLAEKYDKNRLEIRVLDDELTLPLDNFDLIIDALLGTGVTRTLHERYLQVLKWINSGETPAIALDLPTGLHADTGALLGDAVRAELTVTMGALKAGLLVGQGPAYSGTVKAVEIGIPDVAIKEAAARFGCAYVPSREAINSWLPRRALNSHKYSVGMALLVAGSPGLTGAATLASTAAARSGAGAVVCATHSTCQDLLATKMTEIMTAGLPATSVGITSSAAIEHLQPHLQKAASLLIGCGMGRKPDTQSFIRELATQTDLPTVIDADGLNAFSEHTELFSQYAGGQWILTPHLGEFKRLAGEHVDLSDPIDLVRRYAQTWNCVLVLKGAPTLVGTPEGQVFVNPIVNPALATAGSGDVLAGLCAGFLAQGLKPVQAALTALYLGGEAANLYTATHHPATMLASDLIEQFNRVMNDYKT